MYKTNINHSDRKQANVVLSSATIGSLESSLQALCKHLHLLHEKACFVDCAKTATFLSLAIIENMFCDLSFGCRNTLGLVAVAYNQHYLCF